MQWSASWVKQESFKESLISMLPKSQMACETRWISLSSQNQWVLSKQTSTMFLVLVLHLQLGSRQTSCTPKFFWKLSLWRQNLMDWCQNLQSSSKGLMSAKHSSRSLKSQLNSSTKTSHRKPKMPECSKQAWRRQRKLLKQPKTCSDSWVEKIKDGGPRSTLYRQKWLLCLSSLCYQVLTSHISVAKTRIQENETSHTGAVDCE